MNQYTFSVVKNAGAVLEKDACQVWDKLNIYEAVALFGAATADELSLNLYDESGHCISLVQRVDGMDMLCSDYRLYDRWKYDPFVHIAIIPLLVEGLSLRFEYWLTDVSSVVYDRLFYLTGACIVLDCEVEAYLDLDIPKVQNMEIEPLMKRLVHNLENRLGHPLYGICVLQHLGIDYAFEVSGDKITHNDALLRPIYERIKEAKI